MRCRAQHYPKGGTQRFVEGKNGMCRQSGEERLGSCAVKPMFGNRDRRWKSDQPQMREQYGMPGKQMDRPQHLGSEFSPVLGKRTHQPAPLFAIFPKGSFGGAKIALQHYRCTVVERMRQRRGRMNPFQAMVAQGQRREEWRSRSH